MDAPDEVLRDAPTMPWLCATPFAATLRRHSDRSKEQRGNPKPRNVGPLWIFADIPLAPAAHAEACVVFEIETVCDPIIICADPPDRSKKDLLQ